MLQELLLKLNQLSELPFKDASREIDIFIQGYSIEQLIAILAHIGIIPESIKHDSTVEKLFSKVSDSVLSRAFQEIGLQSLVLTERADSADVIAKSEFHNYDLVADAKAFRLSRTAKNQKDFKVEALSNWRKDSNYAVLASPYFQYPSTSSQIYGQALNKNVCLFSWEHLTFLIQNNIKENEHLNLNLLWNFSHFYSERCLVAEQKKNFLPVFNEYFCQIIGKSINEYHQFLLNQVVLIKNRGWDEKQFWLHEEEKIKHYTQQQAIQELLLSKNIDGKIKQIEKYIEGLTL